MKEKIAKMIHNDISLEDSPVNNADRNLARKILSLFISGYGEAEMDCPDKAYLDELGYIDCKSLKEGCPDCQDTGKVKLKEVLK